MNRADEPEVRAEEASEMPAGKGPQLDARGWPVLWSSQERPPLRPGTRRTVFPQTPGTAWERHDDPHPPTEGHRG